MSVLPESKLNSFDDLTKLLKKLNNAFENQVLNENDVKLIEDALFLRLKLSSSFKLTKKEKLIAVIKEYKWKFSNNFNWRYISSCTLIFHYKSNLQIKKKE